MDLRESVFYEAGYRAAYPDVLQLIESGIYVSGQDHWEKVGNRQGYRAYRVVPADIDSDFYLLHYPTAARLVTAKSDKRVKCAASHFLHLGNSHGLHFFTLRNTVVVGPKQRIVTTLDEAFVPGFLALAQSLKERAGIPFCLTVILYGPLSEQSKQWIFQLGLDIEFVAREVLGEFVTPEFSLHDRHTKSLWKPLMWKLPYADPVLYVDSDVLCLNSLHEIYSLKPLSVVANQYSYGEGPDNDKDYKASGLYPFNAGIMFFRPSERIFFEMQEFAESNYELGKVPYGDQPIQNDFFATRRSEMLHYVDVTWNCSTFYKKFYPNFDFHGRVKLLHFAHDQKPWNDAPPNAFMEEFWRMWQGFYQRSLPKDLNKPVQIPVRYGLGG